MKAVTISSALLLLVPQVFMACTIVEVTVPPQPSSKNAKIRVLLAGKPAGHVKLSVRLPEGHGQLSLVTGSDGIATLRDLPSGTSCVTATGEGNLSAVLCLAVAADFADAVSSFQMTLEATPFRFLSFEDKVKAVEDSPPTLRIRRLAGTVLDPTGAVIPSSDVQVYKRGKYRDGPANILKTNEIGRFEGSLEPGTYTVIIRKEGFRTEFITVELFPRGSESEMHQTLQVRNGCD